LIKNTATENPRVGGSIPPLGTILEFHPINVRSLDKQLTIVGIEHLTYKIEKGQDLSEIPKSQKRAKPKTLKQYEKNQRER
jgi:hypothetical protein